MHPELEERLLHDSVGADALPLLAFKLERLYLEYGTDGELSLGDYEGLGGTRGAIGAAVHAAFADPDRRPAIPDDNVERERRLKRGFIPWLAGVDPDTEQRRRRVAKWEEIPDEAKPLLERLIEGRLLVRDRRRVESASEEATIVEIAHEALLRQWQLLASWLDEESHALKVLETVRRGSKEWAKNGRADAWLVHHDERLTQTKMLLDRPDLLAALGEVGRVYVRACEDKEAAARAEREAVNAEREGARQRELDDARRLKRRAYVAAVLALAATLLAGIAGLSFRSAQQRSEAVRAVSVVSAAAGLVEPNPTAAALLLTTLDPHKEPAGGTTVAMEVAQAPLATISRGPGAIDRAIFSKDGASVAAFDEDGTVWVWRVDGSVVLRRQETVLT